MLANSKASPIPGLLDTTLSLYPQPPWSAAVIHPLPRCLSVAHVMADVTHSRLCEDTRCMVPYQTFPWASCHPFLMPTQHSTSVLSPPSPCTAAFNTQPTLSGT